MSQFRILEVRSLTHWTKSPRFGRLSMSHGGQETAALLGGDTLRGAACRHLEEVDLEEGIHLREGESLAPITQDIHMAQNLHWQSNPNGSGYGALLG